MKYYFYIILFLIIIIIIIYNIKIKYEILESYSNKYYSDFNIDIDTNKNINDVETELKNDDYDCNGFFDSNSFCELEFETNLCDCKFQKDDLRYIFDSPETCCKRLCRKIPPEQCLSTTPYLKTDYYCKNGDKCKKYNGIILNSKISSNYCGNDPLNNQLLLPFASEEECESTLDPCDKYNVVGRNVNINKSICIKDVNCGFCTNSDGNGKCISGTASGPNDLMQYYYCEPSNVANTYSYTYGNHMEYLLQR
jgi:hypothetical protein